MCLHQLKYSNYPIANMQPNDSFEVAFKEFAMNFNSSKQLASCVPLMKELVENYIPQRTFKSVHDSYEEADYFFYNLNVSHYLVHF